jgi:hypothetical protein
MSTTRCRHHNQNHLVVPCLAVDTRILPRVRDENLVVSVVLFATELQTCAVFSVGSARLLASDVFARLPDVHHLGRKGSAPDRLRLIL